MSPVFSLVIKETDPTPLSKSKLLKLIPSKLTPPTPASTSTLFNTKSLTLKFPTPNSNFKSPLKLLGIFTRSSL